MKNNHIKRILPILIPILCALLVLVLFRFVFYLGYVPSASMEPTIHKGSLILGLRQFGELKTGDIVIFRHDGRTLVKRIAASPGETYILDGSPVTVPANHYLLLGDNAADSYDARYWDDPFTGIECIIAKVVFSRAILEMRSVCSPKRILFLYFKTKNGNVIENPFDF